MQETRIVLTVTHKKPRPADLAETIANRLYMLAYSRGVEVGVSASVVEDEKNADDCAALSKP